jgi:hypothetical protein
MVAHAIRTIVSELDEDLLAVCWFSTLGLALSFGLIHAVGFDPAAWMQ